MAGMHAPVVVANTACLMQCSSTAASTVLNTACCACRRPSTGSTATDLFSILLCNFKVFKALCAHLRASLRPDFGCYDSSCDRSTSRTFFNVSVKYSWLLDHKHRPSKRCSSPAPDLLKPP
jgi:hypothetical protein